MQWRLSQWHAIYKIRRASSDDFLNVGGEETIGIFYVCEVTERWNTTGILGRKSGRYSNYLFENNNFTTIQTAISTVYKTERTLPEHWI